MIEGVAGWLSRQPTRRRVFALFWAMNVAIVVALLAFALR